MNKSETITNLAKALADFQAEIENPKNTAKNPFFNSKYAPLSEVLNITRPLLAKHGLSVLQSPSGDGQNIIISTMLMHSSGEWIEADPLVLKAEKATAQGAGSAITYARRYALSAILGISSEDDDDGNHAAGTSQNNKSNNGNVQNNNNHKQDNTQNANQGYSNKSSYKLSEAQVKRAYTIAKTHGKSDADVKKWIMEKYNKTSVTELNRQEYENLCDALKE